MTAPTTIPDAAYAVLREWLPSNLDPDRPLTSLATVSRSGFPDVRTVLLSEYDPSGFYFHTDSHSRKALELAASPRAALSMVWPELGRQLSVVGTVERASSIEEEAVYTRTSRYLQILAWLNTTAFAQLPADERRTAWSEFAAAHPDGTLTPPSSWAGYLVRPHRLTFWRGDPATASQRTEYQLTEAGSWRVSVLAG